MYYFSLRCRQKGHIVRDCNQSFLPIQNSRCDGFDHNGPDCSLNIEIQKGYLTDQNVREMCFDKMLPLLKFVRDDI